MKCTHKPKEVQGPIGQYHCPVCGMMVMAGMSHPLFVFFCKEENISEQDKDFLGMSGEGWYAMGIDYSVHGPYVTSGVAWDEWKKEYKRFTGQEWELLDDSVV